MSCEMCGGTGEIFLLTSSTSCTNCGGVYEITDSTVFTVDFPSDRDPLRIPVMEGDQICTKDPRGIGLRRESGYGYLLHIPHVTPKSIPEASTSVSEARSCGRVPHFSSAGTITEDVVVPIWRRKESGYSTRGPGAPCDIFPFPEGTEISHVGHLLGFRLPSSKFGFVALSPVGPEEVIEEHFNLGT